MPIDESKVREALEPCPFCGAHLTIRNSANPYGRCDTEGCWMAKRKMTIPLDDPEQVAAWNTRTPPAQAEASTLPGEVPETMTIRLNITEQQARDMTRVARWERESMEALEAATTADALPGEVVERPIAEHPCHGLFVSAGDRLTHRHWFQDNALMPTCERCGTPIDRNHNETGPVSWEPEKRREIVTLQDRYAISQAAMAALGEWLVWPDAGRDGPREVTVAQTLSFLKGLPNKLGYGSPPTTPAVESGEGEMWEFDPTDGFIFFRPDPLTRYIVAELQSSDTRYGKIIVEAVNAVRSRPAPRASEQDVERVAERIFDFANEYILQPKPKSEQDFADPENYWHRAALAAIKGETT